MLANNGMLATYLARNHSIPHYAETDGEKLLMALKHLRSERMLQGEQGVIEYIRNLYERKNIVGLMLISPLMLEYATTLFEASTHYHETAPLTTTWIKSQLMTPHGGVSIIQVFLFFEC